MRLVDFLSADRIVIPLEAPTVRAATRRLVHALVEAGAVAEPAKLEQLLRDAWPEDIVAVGPETMLPHFRTDAVSRTAVALGVARHPICREHDPNRCARLIVLIVSPPREAGIYLQVVSAFARLLAQESVVEKILAAQRAADVLAIEGLLASHLPGRLQVRDVMTHRVLSVAPDAPLREVARLLVQHNVRALPVVDRAGGVIGMISDRELLKHLIPAYLQRESTGEMRGVPSPGELAPDPGDLPVRKAMGRSVLCLSEDQSLADAANLMVNKERDRFPVVRDGVLVGFLTRADVVRRLIAPE